MWITKVFFNPLLNLLCIINIQVKEGFEFNLILVTTSKFKFFLNLIKPICLNLVGKFSGVCLTNLLTLGLHLFLQFTQVFLNWFSIKTHILEKVILRLLVVILRLHIFKLLLNLCSVSLFLF